MTADSYAAAVDLVARSAAAYISGVPAAAGLATNLDLRQVNLVGRLDPLA